MSKTIVQKVVFRNTTPRALYEIYMDSKKHSASIGAPVKISNKAGGVFSAHNGYCFGKNLQLVKDKLIVQSWRAADWAKGVVDSTFIIEFEAKGKDTIIYVTHANVPDKHATGLNRGWHDYYWKPWKKYLAGSR